MIPHASPRREAQRTRQLPRPLLSGGGGGWVPPLAAQVCRFSGGFGPPPRPSPWICLWQLPAPVLSWVSALSTSVPPSGTRPGSVSAAGFCLLSLRCLSHRGPGLGLSCLWVVSVNGNALFSILRWDSGPQKEIVQQPEYLYVCAHSCCLTHSAGIYGVPPVVL